MMSLQSIVRRLFELRISSFDSLVRRDDLMLDALEASFKFLQPTKMDKQRRIETFDVVLDMSQQRLNAFKTCVEFRRLARGWSHMM